MVSHRRSTQPGTSRSVRVTVISAAAATAAAALGAGGAHAEPQDTPRTAGARVDRLFAEAERATERYNRAGEDITRLRDRIGRAQDRAARVQERVNRLREELGSAAREEYRSGGIDPSLALMLSSDPDTYLDRAATLGRVRDGRALTLDRLRKAQRALAQTRAEAAGALAELERGRAAVSSHKRTVERKLREARRLLKTLPARDRDTYGRASRGARSDASWPLTGLPAGSSRAAAAVAAATGALGRPYVWGANGPSGFDCSGLMQWAYAQAGVSLPRTSQAQRYAGRQVPLSEARPGDLVVYRADASHVGMYVGGGRVIHAPYPGAAVRYDPVGMMPVSSVTRV
ncbi:NlpC/P60 family protein [Streptomyces sp. NPDC001478]